MNRTKDAARGLNFQAQLVPESPGHYLALTSQLNYVHVEAEFSGDTFLRFTARGSTDFDSLTVIAFSKIEDPRELCAAIFPSPPLAKDGQPHRQQISYSLSDYSAAANH